MTINKNTNRVGCLQSYDTDGDGRSDEGEQMGEGWSDFFTLITSAKSTDSGSSHRGIGTYVQGRDTSAIGFRPFPYSTDMSVNPMTYDDIGPGAYGEDE